MVDYSISAAGLQAMAADERAQARAITKALGAYVHEYKGRFYVAQHLPQNGQFIAPIARARIEYGDEVTLNA